MKSTVEQLSPTRVKILVEVPFDELKPNFDRAYAKIAQQVRIPGFRPGKVPARVLESRIGRGAVLDEVVNEAIPAKYVEAVEADDVKTLGQPEFDVTKIEDGQVLEFAAEVDVRPKITVPPTGDIAVTVDPVKADDEGVDAELQYLRARFGTLTGVERPAETGDFVSIDLKATVDGKEVPEAATEGLSYEIGSGQLIEGIDDALVGMNANDTKQFTTKLVAGEHAGKDAEVTVTVQSVKHRELPEADDDFAQLASEFDTIQELKENLATQVGSMKRMEQGVQARDKVLEALLEAADIPLPETVVQAEVDRRKHDAVHAFDHDEAQLAKALEADGSSLEEFHASARDESEQAVKAQLLLDTIADANEVTVDDNELTERIIYQAQRFGVSPDEYVQRAQQSGQLGAIYADVRRGKALATVVRDVKITDTDGNDVDLTELFGAPSDETPAEASDEAPAAETSEA